MNESENTELLQLEESLAKMEHRLQMRYCQMGKSILEMADSELKAIDMIVEEIIETRIKIAEAKREIQCPECMTLNSEDSKFCRRCGSPLEKEKENCYEAG